MLTTLINAALRELGIALTPFFDALDSEPRRRQLLEMVGYGPDSLQGASLMVLITNLQADYIAVQTLLAAPTTSLTDLQVQLNHFLTILQVLDDLKELLRQANPANGSLSLARELTIALFGNYLKGAHPTIYALLVLLGLIGDPEEQDPVLAIFDNTGNLVRTGYRPYYIHFDKIATLLQTPQAYFKNEYYLQGIPTRAISNQVADKIFPRLGIFLSSLGFKVNYGIRAYGLSYGIISDEIQSHMLTVALPSEGNGHFGFTLGLSSTQDGNLGLIISPFGTLTYHGDFTHWLVNLVMTASIDGLAIGPNGVLLGDTNNSSNFGATASITSQPGKTGAAFLLGVPNGTHLAIDEMSLNAELQVANDQANYGVMAKLSKVKFVLKAEGSNGFVKAILPADGISTTFDFGIGWSNAKGFYFLGSATLKARYVFNNNESTRMLSIRAINVQLAANNNGITINSTVSGQVTLGPVQVALEEIGIAALITFPPAHGNLGIANLDLDFKYPSGIKIAIKSDTIEGGGYLNFDHANNKYTGAAHLKFGSKLNLNAIGILQTVLPNNRPGYSLLLLITAQFTPIQLGLGFTLNGVGGLVGINRTINVDYLRSQVQVGNLDKLMFPDNILDNPAQVLSTVDSSFPAAEGRYVFGLMARIGWGTPTLITLDLALIIELPTQVRLVLLGVLKAILPDKDHEVIRLRADFLGVVDFGAKKVSFDASLSDSKILNFALTGNAAFRLYQGNNPVFLLTAGGFNAAFQPPTNADLPKLNRLTLVIANSNDLKITLSSYIAITSNTVQFGSRLDLFVDLPAGYYLEGFMGFDVLFQFHPFRVEMYMGARMAIKKNKDTKLAITLFLNITGPAPWHIVGQATFTIVCLQITVRVNKTFGAGAVAQPLVEVDVYSLFKQALENPKSWEIEAPATASPVSVVLKAPTGNTPTLLIDPNGALVLRQRLIPLGYVLEKYGSNSLINGDKFDIKDIQVLDGGSNAIDIDGTLDDVSDFFAPEQFRRMTDAQKLSSPSFQLMRCGRRLSGLAKFTSVPGTRRVVEYEDLIIPAAPTANGTSTDPELSRVVQELPNNHGASVKPPLLLPEVYKKLARNSAIGRAYRQQQPSANVPKPVQWSEDEYVVVNARDLSRVAGLPTSFANEALATQYLRQQLKEKPSMKDHLLVLPAYQLELSLNV